MTVPLAHNKDNNTHQQQVRVRSSNAADAIARTGVAVVLTEKKI